jgi:hypothetical protein
VGAVRVGSRVAGAGGIDVGAVRVGVRAVVEALAHPVMAKIIAMKAIDESKPGLRVPNKIKIPVILRSYATKNLRCFASTPFRLSRTGASFC